MKSCLAGLTVLLLATTPTRTARCDALAALAVPGATFPTIQSVPGGGFVAPSGADGAFRGLPAFCRVAATLKPTSDSDVRIEVWLPEDGWNRKIQAVGNGAFNGNINYSGMAAALARGYATASTDTGHTGGGAAWALGHSEKVVDFGWRAVHEMAVAARRIVTGFYESAPVHAYWNGCSAGGRQALMEAQRFPADFDGIVAGSPGLDWTSRATAAVDIAKGLASNEAARLSQADRQLLHRAVLEATRLTASRTTHRKSAAVLIRSGGPPLQGSGRHRLSHEGADRHGRTNLRGWSQSGDRAADRRTRAWQRAWLDRSGLDDLGARHRARSVPLPGLRGSGVDDSTLRLRDQRRPARENGCRDDQRARCEPAAVSRSRRQADSTTAGAIADLAVERVQYSRVLAALGGTPTCAAVTGLHGARNGPLRRRRRQTVRWSACSSAGSNKARDRTSSSRPIRPAAASIARIHSVRTRRRSIANRRSRQRRFSCKVSSPTRTSAPPLISGGGAAGRIRHAAAATAQQRRCGRERHRIERWRRTVHPPRQECRSQADCDAEPGHRQAFCTTTNDRVSKRPARPARRAAPLGNR